MSKNLTVSDTFGFINKEEKAIEAMSLSLKLPNGCSVQLEYSEASEGLLIRTNGVMQIFPSASNQIIIK